MVLWLLLVPLFWGSRFGAVCFIFFATYSSVNIFSQVSYVALAKQGNAAVLPLVVCCVTAETIGLAAGQLACGAVVQTELITFEQLYLVSLVLGILLFIAFCGKRSQKLLHAPSTAIPREVIKARCETIAELANLTRREGELLVELAEGNTADEIAAKLFISVATVRTHTRNIYRKVDVHSQTELIKQILQQPK